LQYSEFISESANTTTTLYDLIFSISSKTFLDLTITFTDCYRYLSNKQYWAILVIIGPVLQTVDQYYTTMDTLMLL